MRTWLTLICLLLMFSCAVDAAQYTSDMGVYRHPETWIDVLTTSTYTGSCWNWTYALTPVNANHVRGFTLTLGHDEVALVSNIIDPVGWTSVVNVDNGTISWSTTPGGPYTLDATQSETFVYGFDHPWGNPKEIDASAQDTYGYSGPVTGPTVPEPMGIMACIVGLSSLAGLRRLRK